MMEIFSEIFVWALTAIFLISVFVISPFTFLLFLFGGFLAGVAWFLDFTPKSPYLAVMAAFFAGFVLCLLTSKYISKFMFFCLQWIKAKVAKHKNKADRCNSTF